ncbi:hypothetical protein BD413DRAFT_603096 [Trametes elegans]|nr:hypothetical protein BD413DRAFT_603096 [Trametes elegans]
MAFNSLFGAKPAGQTGNPLFGQNQPQGSSLFGNSQQQQQQQGTSTFSGFGQPPQNQNQGTQGSSLFGSTLGQNPQQQQPQQSSLFGSSFGQPQQQQQQQGQQQQQPTNNLFGQPSGQQQPKPLFGAGTGSLFGNTQNQQGQQGQQQQGTFGGFGSLGQSTATGGFGSSTLQPQATQSSLFGGSTAPAQTGSSLWGRPATQQQQQQPQGAPLFTKSTKFNDLPDELKKTFENIDSFIQGRVQICNDLKQRKLGDEALKGQEEIRSVHKELTGAITVLTADVQHTKDLKHKVEQTVQDTIVATRVVEGFRNPQQNGQYLKTYANFPLEFFYRVSEQMKERLRWYKATIEHIERKLSSAASQPQHTPQGMRFPKLCWRPSPHSGAATAIVATLEAQHATFMALAAKAAAVDAELQKLRTLYTQLWRQKTGSMRDPFNELDRGADVGELGLESLSAK